MKYLSIFIFLTTSLLCHAQNIDSLKSVINNSSSKKQKAEVYNDLANLYLDIDLDEARKYAISAMSLGEETNDFAVLSNAYVNYANAFYFEGNLDSTLFYFQKSYNEITKTEDKNEIAASLNRLGLVYEAKSNYSDAAHYYYQALSIYQETNHKPGLANIYNNLGIINDVIGNKERSIIYYTSARDMFVEINDLDGQANTYNNLATLYAEKNELDKAISFIKIAIEILRRTNSKAATATAYFNASTFYGRKGEADSARQTLDSALVYYQFTDNLHGIANVFEQEAALLAKQKKYQEAINILYKCLDIREKVGNLSATTTTLKKLSETYQEQGNNLEALNYYKSYSELKDSIFNESTNKIITELNIKYETAEKNKAISLLQKESEINQSQKTFLLIISIAFAAISILLLYSFRTKSKFVQSQKEFFKQRETLAKLENEKQLTEKKLLEKEIKVQQKINELQKTELQHSKRELVTSTMQILNKNKILSEINEAFVKFKPIDKEEKEVIKNIAKKVKRNINLDEDWDQFKLHFDKVNRGFFEKLQKQYPELTTGDLKVCAYVKINLSPKEIAQIMNISIDGINKRLYRIRRKINLASNTNLGSYLADF